MIMKKMCNKCVIVAAFFLCMVYVMTGCHAKNTLEVKKLYINDVSLYVEIADDQDERVNGLQHRTTSNSTS